MKKCFILLILSLVALPVYADQEPPSCEGEYQYVTYGTWEFENDIWSMPFVCSTGKKGEVNVSINDLSKTGRAVYYISSGGKAENFKRYPAPCKVMFEYCKHQILVSDFGFDTEFYESKM